MVKSKKQKKYKKGGSSQNYSMNADMQLRIKKLEDKIDIIENLLKNVYKTNNLKDVGFDMYGRVYNQFEGFH